ncbi:MAG TPA: hypothetical protein VNX21_07715 [Candidatus Thermoplasmatota archaeon]|nr:hypothetical protein [Candidatus Thermoplasmatota archaeon]
MIALLMIAGTFGASASSRDAAALDLSAFQEGDVVLRGAKVDGVCVYPDVSAVARAGTLPTLLRGTDDCEIVHAGQAADGPGCYFGGDELVAPPGGCIGSEGELWIDTSGGCLDGRHVDPAACAKEPSPASAALGGLEDGIALPASHCPSRTLNAKISSGPTSVGVSMNYREHCNAGARVNTWTSWCSWSSGQGWRNRYFSYGGGATWDVAWRWTECAFDHRHGSTYDAYHYMGTEVDGWNYYSDVCYFWWSWNPHTNYVTYSCWYS